MKILTPPRFKGPEQPKNQKRYTPTHLPQTMASFAMTKDQLAAATLDAIKARAVELESPLSDEDAAALGSMMASADIGEVTEEKFNATMEQLKAIPKEQFDGMLMMAKMMSGGDVDAMAQQMAAAMGGGGAAAAATPPPAAAPPAAADDSEDGEEGDMTAEQALAFVRAKQLEGEEGSTFRADVEELGQGIKLLGQTTSYARMIVDFNSVRTLMNCTPLHKVRNFSLI